MKITREDILPTEVTLNIELEPDDVEPYLDRAYKRVVNRVRIPGFRKGKAPRAIVESFVGRDHLLHEALDVLIPESVALAAEQEKLEDFLQPEVDLLDLDPLSIKATIPFQPELVLGDYHNLRMESEPVDITDEQVGNIVENLRYESAPWEPVERPIQFNDLVTMDVGGTVDGRSVADDKSIDFMPSKDNALPLPGFSAHLEGLSKNESKSFDLTVPEDYNDASISGKQCRFEVTVHEIKQKVLPDVNDEFAKGIGGNYDTLQELQEGVRENLTQAAQREATQDLHERALQAVITNSQAQFSNIIAEREVDHLMQERTRALQGRGVDMEAYLKTVGKSEEELREELRPTAKERLIRTLVLRKLAEEEKIEVTAEEVDDEIEVMTAQSHVADGIKRFFSSQEGRNSIERAVLTRKTLECLSAIVQNSEEELETPSSIETNNGSDQGGTESDD